MGLWVCIGPVQQELFGILGVCIGPVLQELYGILVCIGPVQQELYGIMGVYRASSTGTVWDSGCV